MVADSRLGERAGSAPEAGGVPLTDLMSGEVGTVERLDVRGEARWRLMDLGLLPGTRVVAELRGPLGEPVVYRVRGALIAVRREQAECIVVTRTRKETRVAQEQTK